ncbi:hypothetical protein AURDEDRAFT_63786 [Auricularia subglabra TFB-10046 SS5]|nr:hypothetical protein AURDEDRAFT_63786 [Auricularia subglabra TFB-10046 SS5]
MKILNLAIAASAILVAGVAGQDVDVPPSAAAAAALAGSIPDIYNGLYRPQVSFSPQQHFINDPCGLFVDASGLWHLYYQYNPAGLSGGNQHWGHATSTDLYHWKDEPIALYPSDAGQIWDGSIVIDVNDTSGFFPNQTDGVAVIYTLNGQKETQRLAYSLDGGYTFTEYENNPVLDVNSSQFRDPKLSWHEDHWVMVVAYATDLVVGFYTSPDLKEWTHASNFSFPGLGGLQWECPNLVEVPIAGSDSGETMYVLKLSISPGAPLGGSIDLHFPGDFNGTHFAHVDGVAHLADFSKDNYATQFFYGTPQGADAISISWASNWQYGQDVPTANEGWRGQMAVPRRNYLANLPCEGWTLVQEPYQLQSVLGPELGSSANGELYVNFSSVTSNAIYFEASVAGLSGVEVGADAWLNFTVLSPESGESLSGGYQFAGNGTFLLDRGNTHGFSHPDFTSTFTTSVSPDELGTWRASGIIDRSVMEVFINGGQHVATTTFYPTAPLTQFVAKSAGLPDGVNINVTVWGLESIWAQ